ncbi:hypothetical protein V5O48_000455 [Marasmius crinis-equi]|uniref:Uncharacterized protein n=1 Tax=Marasmius crinis-equi TaxID=585013 RepID=A0ABR3G1B9_9AGAR
MSNSPEAHAVSTKEMAHESAESASKDLESAPIAQGHAEKIDKDKEIELGKVQGELAEARATTAQIQGTVSDSESQSPNDLKADSQPDMIVGSLAELYAALGGKAESIFATLDQISRRDAKTVARKMEVAKLNMEAAKLLMEAARLNSQTEEKATRRVENQLELARMRQSMSLYTDPDSVIPTKRQASTPLASYRPSPAHPSGLAMQDHPMHQDAIPHGMPLHPPYSSMPRGGSYETPQDRFRGLHAMHSVRQPHGGHGIPPGGLAHSGLQGTHHTPHTMHSLHGGHGAYAGVPSQGANTPYPGYSHTQMA